MWYLRSLKGRSSTSVTWLPTSSSSSASTPVTRSRSLATCMLDFSTLLLMLYTCPAVPWCRMTSKARATSDTCK